MKLKLDIFEGPLDLLLYLIKKNHLEISDISITQVVDQYLQFLEFMKLLDLTVASEYLLMAANLISIKSKSVLPKEEEEPQEEEENADLLVKRLLEYEKFKEAAGFLRNKENQRNKYFSRPPSSSKEYNEPYIEASIFDLISAFKSALKEVPKDVFFEVIKEEFTVEDKIHDILHVVLEKNKVSLEKLFSQSNSKIEIVVTFLAILELIKLKEIVAVQEQLFGPISIARPQLVNS
ncbi:MAG: segregation/condensation protein A [Candidatus Omnitrophica bacterium]|nr:segregation/condensation protein A [Candidatus Omnitrophota bacterium]MCF7877588.1 segregation/condensation protein A [Candidatus Omnitrophota bacterium]MCF7877924.1 segregation/condensation protein A [Candidatus Omnitrophota bacterium]MCF7893183.1 segregation/condensation protein A [Candidatus Omnitrophota bacterium]